jgi:YVTN family beta-propeller protein
MRDRTGGDPLYPNRGGEPDEAGVSRRRLLAGSAAAGAAATAGCTTRSDAGGGRDTVFVFNTGDRTVSVIDPAADEVVSTQYLGFTSSFPSNQFTPRVVTDAGDVLWLNVGEGVRAVAAGSLAPVARVETGSGANWQEVTPDGSHLVVSAREPAHAQYRVDADPGSDSFGEVTGELDRSPEGGRGDRDGPGPCDVTMHPDGEYAYVPDLFGDTLTVLDVDSFDIVTQVEVEPATDADAAAPWMATATWDGETLLVEHDEGDAGTESVWDVSDPAAPELVARLTADDDLGEMPLTSEIGPDSRTGYVFTPGTEDVTVIDLNAGAVAGRIGLGGTAFVGTWEPSRETLYVPVQTSDEVAVVDHAAGEVTARISVGPEPYGATAGRVRPEAMAADEIAARLAALDGDHPDAGTSYCIGNCGCSHRL